MCEKSTPERERSDGRRAWRAAVACALLLLGAADAALAGEVDVCAAERQKLAQAETQHCLSREGAADCTAGRVQSIEIDVEAFVWRTADEYLTAARELVECERQVRRAELGRALQLYLQRARIYAGLE
jgi:uncharacterized membrane protein